MDGGLPGPIAESFGAFEPRFYGISFLLETPSMFQAWAALSGISSGDRPALPVFEHTCLQTAIEHEMRHFHDALVSPFANVILMLRMMATFNGLKLLNRAQRSGANLLPVPVKTWMAMSPEKRTSAGRPANPGWDRVRASKKPVSTAPKSDATARRSGRTEWHEGKAIANIAERRGMMRLRFPSGEVLRYAGPILACGAALLTILVPYRSVLEQHFGKLPFLDSELVFYLSIVLIVIGGGLILLWLIGFLLRHILIGLTRSLGKTLDWITKRNSLTLEPCNAEDLGEISRLASEEFGDISANLERNQWLASFDSSAYTKVMDDRGRIVGFYDMFRLTKLGVSAIHRGEFDITTCPRDYLRTDKKYTYNYIYLGGLYGRNRLAKAMILGAMRQKLLLLRPKAVFARAATKDGLRLIEKERFRPILAGKVGIGALYEKDL
jgi:hypothetical protein